MHTLASAIPSDHDLRAQLVRRLAQLDAERPDLASALALQGRLLTRELDLLDMLLSGGVPGLALPARYLATKLKGGIPVLHGEPVPLPGGLLTLALRDFCGQLGSGPTAEATRAIELAIDEARLDAGAVLSACFGRDQHRVRHMAAQAGASADILWLVAELALAPFAHLLQLQLFASADQDHGETCPLREAVTHWDRGYCPACGTWPALTEVGPEGHTLRCAFCARGWSLQDYRCVYCGDDGEQFLTAALDPEVPGRRLQLCGACGGYMKVLERDHACGFPLVALEDMVSLDLDMAALERHYVRPPLPQIRRTHTT